MQFEVFYLLLVLIDYIFDFSLDDLLVDFFLLGFLCLVVDVPPAVEGFELEIPVVVFVCLFCFEFVHLRIEFVLVEEGEGTGEVFGYSDSLVEFGDVSRHQFDLHGLLLQV